MIVTMTMTIATETEVPIIDRHDDHQPAFNMLRTLFSGTRIMTVTMMMALALASRMTIIDRATSSRRPSKDLRHSPRGSK